MRISYRRLCGTAGHPVLRSEREKKRKRSPCILYMLYVICTCAICTYLTVCVVFFYAARPPPPRAERVRPEARGGRDRAHRATCVRRTRQPHRRGFGVLRRRKTLMNQSICWLKEKVQAELVEVNIMQGTLCSPYSTRVQRRRQLEGWF